MDQTVKKLALSLSGLLFSASLAGQGCSDAGVCTAGSMGSFYSAKPKSYLSIGQSFGRGEAGISVFVTQLTAQFQLSANTAFQIKVPFQINQGSFATTSGLSDPIFVLSHDLGRESEAHFNLNIGVKIPAGAANQDLEGTPLPMPYQTTLGSFDLLAGFAFTYGGFLASVGFQQPLTANQNEYNGVPLDGVVFDTTVQFFRKPDLVFRIAQGFEWKKWTFSAGALPILHLGQDTYENQLGERKEISGSGGLTLNITGEIVRKLGERNRLVLNLAAPVIVRDARPDGLTRSFVMGLTWRADIGS